jgi:signal transduction histidine kinase
LNSLNMLAQAAFDSIQSKPIEVRKTISESVYLLRSHPNFSKTTFDIDVSESLAFVGDELKLSVLLKCLLENALAFGKENQQISLSISAWIDEDRVILEVEDNGIGISQEVQDKIFDMFYRGSERSQGAGLGLYIVKSIVERLGGSVSFTSLPGKTVFRISLPALDPTAEVPSL